MDRTIIRKAFILVTLILALFGSCLSVFASEDPAPEITERSITVYADEDVTCTAPEYAVPGETVEITADRAGNPAFIFGLEIYNADGDAISTTEGSSFVMPDEDIVVKVITTIEVYAPGPTLAPPKPFRSLRIDRSAIVEEQEHDLVVECPRELEGVEFQAPEKVFPGQPITVERVYTQDDVPYEVSIVGLDIYNLRNNEFLFSVEGAQFKMPQQDALVKVRVITTTHSSVTAFAITTEQGNPKDEIEVTAPSYACEGETVTVTVVNKESEDISDELRLDIYDMEGVKLFSVNNNTFEMPGEPVSVKVWWETVGEPPIVYSINTESYAPIEGVEYRAPECAAPGTPVTVKCIYDPEQFSYSMDVCGLDVYSLETNTLLLSVDGDTFKMPHENVKVVVRTGVVSNDPYVLHLIELVPEEAWKGVKFVAPAGACAGDTVEVKVDTAGLLEVPGITIYRLDIYDTNEKLLFSEEGNQFTMPDENVVVKIQFYAIGAPLLDVNFEDVNDSTPHHQAIEWAARSGLAKGYSDGTFRPLKECTRAELVIMLWKLKGSQEPDMSESMPFTDVTKKRSSAQYKAILWAYQNNVTKGYSDGTFKPGKAVTRGEILRFIWNVSEKPAIHTAKSPFKDLPKIYPHYKAIVWAWENGITKGYSDGTFRSNNSATRGEAVEFLYRVR